VIPADRNSFTAIRSASDAARSAAAHNSALAAREPVRPRLRLCASCRLSKPTPRRSARSSSCGPGPPGTTAASRTVNAAPVTHTPSTLDRSRSSRSRRRTRTRDIERRHCARGTVSSIMPGGCCHSLCHHAAVRPVAVERGPCPQQRRAQQRFVSQVPAHSEVHPRMQRHPPPASKPAANRGSAETSCEGLRPADHSVLPAKYHLDVHSRHPALRV
jgi:hypothetical protein